MTKKYQPENSLANSLQFNAALALMSETELASLLDKVEALEDDFQHISVRDGESIEDVALVQKLLKIWNTEVDRILQDKQATDAYEELHRWDYEGGMVDPNPSRRVVIRIENGKRRVAWADAEEKS